jgi:hypothetical protein
MNGKGDKWRPTDMTAYRKSIDRIFRKKTRPKNKKG